MSLAFRICSFWWRLREKKVLNLSWISKKKKRHSFTQFHLNVMLISMTFLVIRLQRLSFVLFFVHCSWWKVFSLFFIQIQFHQQQQQFYRHLTLLSGMKAQKRNKCSAFACFSFSFFQASYSAQRHRNLISKRFSTWIPTALERLLLLLLLLQKSYRHRKSHKIFHTNILVHGSAFMHTYSPSLECEA